MLTFVCKFNMYHDFYSCFHIFSGHNISLFKYSVWFLLVIYCVFICLCRNKLPHEYDSNHIAWLGKT
jgi:hypothetical protein